MNPIRIGMFVALTTGVIAVTGCSSTTTGTDGGGTDSGGTEGGGGEGGTCNNDNSCANYCSVMMASCSGQMGLVTDMATCMAVCAKLPAGMKGATDGNSIGCRAYHACVAGSSAANKTMHCPHADVWEGNSLTATCGTTCDAFCAVQMAVCTGANAQFPGMNECTSACGLWMDGTTGATSGNTRACREYHLGVAAQTAANATMHCPHTGNGGGDAGPNTTCGP